MIIQINGRRFDRWIIGEGTETGCEYLIHLGAPRFVCKVGEDALDGLTVNLGRGDMAHSFVFWDEAPPRAELILLMESAREALDRDAAKPCDWPDDEEL